LPLSGEVTLSPLEYDRPGVEKQDREGQLPLRSLFITLDAEEDLGTESRKKTYRGITEGLALFFDLLDDLGARATFFFTGEVAQAFPDVLKEAGKKHEIGCHGINHKAISEFQITERRTYLTQNLGIFQEIQGFRPFGFRAVDFIVDNCLFELLEERGFVYDSSVLSAYPRFRLYRGFEGNAPQHPYHPSHENYRKMGSHAILEMPIPTIPMINSPWSGTWIRTFGASLYRLSVLIFKPTYILIAVHSWDFTNLEGRTRYSRNSGKAFAKILRDLLSFFHQRDYDFLTLTEGSKIYQ